MKRFLLLLSVVSAAGAHAGARFSRNCEVYVQPTFRSDRLCEKLAGANILRVRPGKAGFLKVETSDCDGYVPMTCVTASDDRPQRALSTAAERSERMERGERGERGDRAESGTSRKTIRIGGALSAGGMWAKPAGATSGTSGSALMLGIPISFLLGSAGRLTVMPSYQILSLSRTVDGTGSISDLNPVEFTHRVHYVGGAALAGLSLGASSLDDGVRTVWWLEGGIELLTPISATQSDNFSNSQSFSSNDKLFFVEGGPVGEFYLSRDLSLTAALHFFYNLGSKSGNSLLGARLLVSLGFGV